jgi:hypothetical protein
VITIDRNTQAATHLSDFRPEDPDYFENHLDALRQVDRMGNPAVNTALIRANLKDAFNSAQPQNDAQFAGPIQDQIWALDTRFGTCQNGNTTSPTACNPNIPLLASVAIPDILRNASDAPDGYPNGRRLFDRTTRSADQPHPSARSPAVARYARARPEIVHASCVERDHRALR